MYIRANQVPYLVFTSAAIGADVKIRAGTYVRACTRTRIHGCIKVLLQHCSRTCTDETLTLVAVL